MSSQGLEALDASLLAKIPEEWLRALTEKFLSEEDKKLIESLGGWDKLMETLKQRLEEQKKRHEGGNKMIGTAGTSPFGAYGYNPDGVRIGQDKSRHGKAVKVWTSANTRTSTTRSSLARATSRWRCAACANGRGWVRKPNSICPAPSKRPQTRAILTSS